MTEHLKEAAKKTYEVYANTKFDYPQFFVLSMDIEHGSIIFHSNPTWRPIIAVNSLQVSIGLFGDTILNGYNSIPPMMCGICVITDGSAWVGYNPETEDPEVFAASHESIPIRAIMMMDAAGASWASLWGVDGCVEQGEMPEEDPHLLEMLKFIQKCACTMRRSN